MGIGPEQRTYIMRTLLGAIDNFYGDRVPGLDSFKSKRTYMEKLEKEVDATSWRQKIEDANKEKGVAQGVVTRLENNRQSKKTEMDARHQQEIAQLKERQAREIANMVAEYEPSILEAKQKLNDAVAKVSEVVRASYFAGLGIEDDLRQTYGSLTIEKAIAERVDSFISRNLQDDEEGKLVLVRVGQEKLISDAVWIAKDMIDLRAKVISFIGKGKLPKITVEAWMIENCKDIDA